MTSQLLGKSRERERDNEGPRDPPGIKKDEHFGRNNGCKRTSTTTQIQNRLMSVINTLWVCRHRSRGSLSPEEGSLSLSLCIWLYTPILQAVAADRLILYCHTSSAWTFCATSPRRRYSPRVSRSHSRSAIEYRAQRARRYGTSGRGSRR